MAVPKRRISKPRGRKRRNPHNGVTPRQLQSCAQCKTQIPSHVACPTCGFYMGRTVVETED